MLQKQLCDFLEHSGLLKEEKEQQNVEDKKGERISWKRVRLILQKIGISQEQMRKMTLHDVQMLVDEYHSQRSDDFNDLARIIIPALGGSIDDSDLPEEYQTPAYKNEEDKEDGIISAKQVDFLERMLRGAG